jgi:hypothetical protein
MEHVGGVNAWCITVKGTPSSYVCRASDGRQACDAECKESGYPYGGTCDPTDGCLCLMCQDQGPPHPHAL